MIYSLQLSSSVPFLRHLPVIHGGNIIVFVSFHSLGKSSQLLCVSDSAGTQTDRRSFCIAELYFE